MVLWFYVQEHPKAQPAELLVLKRLRRRGYELKSHPTDWERVQSKIEGNLKAVDYFVLSML